MAKSGLPDYELNHWYGFITSATVAAPIVKKLHGVIGKTLQSAEVAQRLTADGSDIMASTPRAFGEYINRVEKWRKLVQVTNLKLN